MSRTYPCHVGQLIWRHALISGSRYPPPGLATQFFVMPKMLPNSTILDVASQDCLLHLKAKAVAEIAGLLQQQMHIRTIAASLLDRKQTFCHLSIQPLVTSLTAMAACCGGPLAGGPKLFTTTGAVLNTCMPFSFSRTPAGRDKPGTLGCPATCTSAGQSSYDPSSLRLPGYRFLDSEAQILAALENGPVLSSMATNPEFKMLYRCGVYTTTQTVFTRLHAVEIVDYGTTSGGLDFYVVKNSWGIHYGENGYFRIKRGDLGIGRGTVTLVTIFNNAVVTETKRLPVIALNLTSPGTPKQVQFPANTFDYPSCSIMGVPNPMQNANIQEAARYALDELVRLAVAKCPDGSAATRLTLDSFMNATAQTVAGIMYYLTLDTRVQGCSSNIGATIEADIFLNTNGSFILTSYSYTLDTVGPTNPSTVRPTTPNAGMEVNGSIPILTAMLLLAITAIAAFL